MSWVIVLRKDGQSVRHEFETRRAAVTIACMLSKQDIEVERVEGPDGQKLDAAAVRRLCETP